MINDAFVDVDPYLPGMVVVLEPSYMENFLGHRPDPRQTARWARDIASLPWLDLMLDEAFLGPEALRFLKGEIFNGHIPRDKVYLVAPDRDSLKAAWMLGVKGAVIPGIGNSAGDSLKDARGYLQRIQQAQKLLAWKHGTYRLGGKETIPVLMHQEVDDGTGLEALVQLQQEGLVQGCIDATPEGTILEAYDPGQHGDLTVLRNGENAQAWYRWNKEVKPLLRASALPRLWGYIKLQDRWHFYTGGCEKPNTLPRFSAGLCPRTETTSSESLLWQPQP